MSMVSEQTYSDVMEEVAALSEQEFADTVTAVYVSGSVARGDFTPGRSDIDLYVVLDERNRSIEAEYRHHLDELEAEYLPELQQIEPDAVSVAFTSTPEIERGESFLGSGFAYHTFVENGHLLYGSDVRDRIQEPTRAEEIEAAQQVLESIEARATHLQDRVTREAFSTIFRTLCVFLGGHGVYVGAKEDAVEESTRLLDDQQVITDIEQTYSLYEAWEQRSLTEDEFFSLIEKYRAIVPTIIDIWRDDPPQQR